MRGYIAPAPAVAVDNLKDPAGQERSPESLKIIVLGTAWSSIASQSFYNSCLYDGENVMELLW